MFAVVLLALLISVPVRAELRDPNNSADYIILTNQEVLSNNAWIDSLLGYRDSQGRVSMAVTVEEIWAEFTPAGSDSAIREFLHYAYDNWQAPRLKDVFIVGHVDVVPSHYVEEFADSIYDFWSDYFFVADRIDSLTLPLFKIGRLPWSPSNSEPLPNFFQKVWAYESQTALCNQTVQLIADSLAGAWSFEFVCDSIASYFPSNVDIERDYTGRLAGDPAYGDREEILANLSDGPFAMFLSGYCGSQDWLSTDSIHINADDLSVLDNAPCYSIYSGMTNSDLPMGSLEMTNMSAAVLNLMGGAIAGFGTSTVSWFISGSKYEFSIAGVLFDAENATVGDIWFEATADYYESGLNTPNLVWVETIQSSVLLGDPATLIPGRITGIDEIAAPVIPSTIQIVGNYPNPFNPSTTINFMLNRAGSARLTVYDITGRAVTTLADQSYAAGQHSLVWNAEGQASGMYLVRLESAGQFSTHRVTLLK